MGENCRGCTPRPEKCVECTNHAQGYRWFACFHGRESLEDDANSGRQVSAWSNKNVGKTHAIVTQDRLLTTRLLVHLGICEEVPRQILEREWQKKNVPHSLKAEQRQQ